MIFLFTHFTYWKPSCGSLSAKYIFIFRNIMKYSTIYLLSTMHFHKFIVRALKVLSQIHMHICHTQSYVIQRWTFFSIAKETLCRWDHTIMMIMATCLRGQEANFLSRPCHTFSLHLYILLLSLSLDLGSLQQDYFLCFKLHKNCPLDDQPDLVKSLYVFKT